ncbi:MAG: hypothetical protein ACI9KE_000652 [Polyangiales bacterium]|jgi:hypothetical protein
MAHGVATLRAGEASRLAPARDASLIPALFIVEAHATVAIHADLFSALYVCGAEFFAATELEPRSRRARHSTPATLALGTRGAWV